MTDGEDLDQTLERLPLWVPDYLACWGSKMPDGRRMTVRFAAEFAGTTESNVRSLRARSQTFRRLEDVARNATAEWAQSYVEAGLRALAPSMMRALSRLIVTDHPQTVLKVAEWLRGKPQEVRLTGSGEDGEQVVKFDLSGLPDGILRDLADEREPDEAETGGAG